MNLLRFQVGTGAVQLGVRQVGDGGQEGIRYLDAGFDHGVGHSLLLLYDAKVSNGQKSEDFKGLDHYPFNTSISSF